MASATAVARAPRESPALDALTLLWGVGVLRGHVCWGFAKRLLCTRRCWESSDNGGLFGVAPSKVGAEDGVWAIGGALPFSGEIPHKCGLIEAVFTGESGCMDRRWRLPSSKRCCDAVCRDGVGKHPAPEGALRLLTTCCYAVNYECR